MTFGSQRVFAMSISDAGITLLPHVSIYMTLSNLAALVLIRVSRGDACTDRDSSSPVICMTPQGSPCASDHARRSGAIKVSLWDLVGAV